MLFRSDLQIASRKKERPWEVGKSFDYSAPCSAIQPASKIGHPAKGKIWLTVNGKETQKGDLTELIWNVPEIIWQLSQQVKLAAGDIIMTGTPAGVSQLQPGDKIECGVDGVGIDLTRRDLQIASRKKERPWEVGKSFDYSAPCSALQPASKIGRASCRERVSSVV